MSKAFPRKAEISTTAGLASHQYIASHSRQPAPDGDRENSGRDPFRHRQPHQSAKAGMKKFL
jgi:hypothetical protein